MVARVASVILEIPHVAVLRELFGLAKVSLGIEEVPKRALRTLVVVGIALGTSFRTGTAPKFLLTIFVSETDFTLGANFPVHKNLGNERTDT